MKGSSTPRRWVAWSAALAATLLAGMYPIKDGLVRAVTVVGALGVWVGLIALLWRRRRMRLLLLGATALGVLFVALPGDHGIGRQRLRDEYLERLRRYEGVRYVWGGEGCLGIDCSGLVRKGLVDALLAEGLRSRNPSLVRRAFALWWNDCTARTLGDCVAGMTRRVTEASSLNALDHGLVLPGDLAVTQHGVHVMAYLGDSTWLEADPGLKRVVRERAPTSPNPWLKVPVTVVRWSVLDGTPMPGE